MKSWMKFHSYDCKKKCKGSSIVELAIAIPVLLLLGLGTIQIGLIYHAKTILNYATFEAARKGAVNHALVDPMRKELGLRLGPIYGGDGDPETALIAMMKGGIDVLDSRFTKLEILNPSSQAFDDWGIHNPISGRLEIPNSHLRQRNSERVVRASSGVNLQDANLLKIKVTYGYKMGVPLVDKLFTRMMMSVDTDNLSFYSSRRIPITSVATLRMQSPAQRDSNTVAVGVISSDMAEPTSLVTQLPEQASVPCDAHGLRDDVSSEELDSLLTSTIDADQCSSASVTISNLLSESVNVNSPLGEEASGSLTDCIPL